MIRGRCPICSKTYKIAKLDDLPTFPFCSPRCRLIDQGRWVDGSYVIPGPPVRNPNPTAIPQDPDDEID